jgi:hypothetical protein
MLQTVRFRYSGTARIGNVQDVHEDSLQDLWDLPYAARAMLVNDVLLSGVVRALRHTVVGEEERTPRGSVDEKQ